MSPSSPSSRARRRVVCILPGFILHPIYSFPSLTRLLLRIPTRSPEFAKTTLLPYYHQEPDEIAPPPPRLPPVDPRKARRFCTDFGLGRAPLPPPPPLKMYNHDNASSAGSTPQATYAETVSDASSFYHDIDLVFPQPPASPAIRRMQSSPLFTSDETNAVREFLRDRFKAQRDDELLSDDYSWDAESPALELAGEALVQGASGHRRRDSWLQLDDSKDYDIPPLRPRRSVVAPSCPPKPVLRRAASMASPPLPPLDNAPPMPSRPLRFQDKGRQNAHHRTNLSVPLLGTQSLGPPFTHRPTPSQPAAQPLRPPKSFIDLTPEKKRESSTHLRVKKLLSRASSGFIGWSKGLTGKKRY
ncbi:hypothetical protein FB45DRAFT_198826 [Roridomyces roridus]|uniref:Uncharacterized protein n=1 Tax=Roridomyces roridus TaxID=1738132 RepID=A0AAD7G049_9AGAR|nr:hypothetical protein FB45DRAFT_198826 [Roridomyces roridus]